MFLFMVYEPTEAAGISFEEPEPTGNIYIWTLWAHRNIIIFGKSEPSGISFEELEPAGKKNIYEPAGISFEESKPAEYYKKSPSMNPYTSKTVKSLKGNCKENNLLNEVISWFGDQKSVDIGLLNQNNKMLINKELWTNASSSQA